MTYLHPSCLKLNMPSTTLAINCPHAIMTTLVETSLPRIDTGATSAMYIGIVIDVKPTIRNFILFISYFRLNTEILI